MDFVQLRSFDNYISAHISMTMLQDAGINCHLQDEYVVTLVSPAVGSMKLMVYPTQAQRANELLDNVRKMDPGEI